ncbi:hypothetical protein MBRA_03002 [Methylobacterium brachiatum]|nr:hypothetical protein MBRA_03002 [Methylobacterium brachiatum]
MTTTSRRLGVLGGLSRRSTIECHQMINRHVLSLTNNRAAADLVTWSLDPDTIIHLLSKDGWPLIVDQIKEAAANLLLEGVDALMIASDTLQCALAEEPIHFGVPVIPVHDALADEIQRLSLRKVGLVGTSATMSGPYYQDLRQGSCNLDVVLPSQNLWVNIDYSVCNRIYNGESTVLEVDTYHQIMSQFEAQGVDGIIVASPEIALAFNKPDPVPVLHTAQIHAAAAARWCVAGRDILRPAMSHHDEAGRASAAFTDAASEDTSKISFEALQPRDLRRKRKRKAGRLSAAAASVSAGQQTRNS